MTPKPLSGSMMTSTTTTTTTELLESKVKLENNNYYKTKVVWINVAIFGALHLGALYGLFLFCFVAKWQTSLFAFVMYIFSGFGITAGAHRLWAHRTYKAKLPLRIFLAFLNTVAFQKDIYDWCREHRSHHKFTDTDADPHNSNRGLFFSHIGWLMMKKHPEVLKKGKTVDLSDIINDPVVAFQRKYYYYLVIICCILFPTILPNYLWGETYWNAYFVSGMLRYVWTLNCTFIVNSLAHKWGDKPYDEQIRPRENMFVSYWAIGEGFHNYHHTFPWDYSTSEYGFKLNITTVFIDFFALLGWAYDRKKVSKDAVRLRKLRTGELSHHEEVPPPPDQEDAKAM